MKKIIKIIIIFILIFTFSYTANIEREAYGKKKDIKMNILFVSNKKIVMDFTNKNDQELYYTLSFTLKKYNKGKWKKVQFKDNAKFPKCLCVLKGNSKRKEKIIWRDYFDTNLKKGKYKIKWIGTKTFKIKK